MIKQKGLKAIIICMLIILSTTCLSLLFTNAYKTFSKQELRAATSYYFESGVLSSDSYDEYTITSLTGLQNFTKSVNNNGLTFYNKTVYLKADIDCGGIALTPIGNSSYSFQGSFTGVYCLGSVKASHYPTIANFKIEKSSRISGYECAGFFTSLVKNAQVKNIRLFNFEISAGTIVGGLVALASQAPTTYTKIEHCWVENLKVTSSSAEYIGGIVGVNQSQQYISAAGSGISIKDCYLYGFIKSGQSKLKYASNIGPSWGNTVEVDMIDLKPSGKTYDSSGAYVATCLVRNGIVNTSNSGFYFYDNDEIGCYNTSGIEYTYLISHSTAWYINRSNGETFYPDYNAGFPILSGFTFWITLTTEGNVEGISLSESRVANTIYSEITFSKNKLTAFGKTITASPESFFSEWKLVDPCSIVAVFEIKSYIINFEQPLFDGNSIGVNPSLTSITVEYGTSIYVTETEENGNVILTYTIGDKIVRYSVNFKYKVVSWGSLGTMPIGNSIKVPDLGANGEVFTVTPELSLKNYNIIFG